MSQRNGTMKSADSRQELLPSAKPLGAAMLSDTAWVEIARSLVLSQREVDIARGVFDNLPRKAIAANLGISEHTIHTHMDRLFDKLGVSTRVEMVLRLVQELFALTVSDLSQLPSICRHRANGRCPVQKRHRA